MTRDFLLVLALASLSCLTVAVCRRTWRTGAAQAVGGIFEGEREHAPLRYWLAMGSWILLGMLAGIRAAQVVSRMLAGTPSPPATVRDAFLLTLELAFLGLLAIVWLKLWRRGNPLLHWRELRREAELRAMIHALVDNPKATYEGQTIDEFAAFASLEWLAEIVAHLQGQHAPRSLARAIDETDTIEPAQLAR